MTKGKNATTEKPAPPTTAELRREGRLTRIAKALASGATVTDIAEAEGIGRTLTSREANSKACRQLIAEFVNAEHVEMRAMFYRSVRAIEHALSARREYLTKEGKIRYGGPDHYARLAATKHFRDCLAAGRPPAPKEDENSKGGLRLYQLEEWSKQRISPIRTGIRLFRHIQTPIARRERRALQKLGRRRVRPVSRNRSKLTKDAKQSVAKELSA